MTSRAASTAFCTDSISANGITLHFDGNGKITGRKGSYAEPKPNAFSIVQIADCPWATPTCKASCYVHGLEKHAKPTHDLYRQNSVAIHKILAFEPAWRQTWAQTMANWIKSHCLDFRWHVSGDVFSEAYARFISDVCKASPDVNHWIYTRSFQYAHALRAPNLVVNLSADRDNYRAALFTATTLGLRICYLSSEGEVPDSLRKGDVIFPDYKLRGRDSDDPLQTWFWQKLQRQPHKLRMICPVDYFGASENIRCGVCTKCMR